MPIVAVTYVALWLSSDKLFGNSPKSFVAQIVVVLVIIGIISGQRNSPL